MPHPTSRDTVGRGTMTGPAAGPYYPPRGEKLHRGLSYINDQGNGTRIRKADMATGTSFPDIPLLFLYFSTMYHVTRGGSLEL